jgi:tetratricopeptide (TPR) repeat protein
MRRWTRRELTSKQGEGCLPHEFRLEAEAGHQLCEGEEGYKVTIEEIFTWMHDNADNENTINPRLVQSRQDDRQKLIEDLNEDFHKYKIGALTAQRAVEKAKESLHEAIKKDPIKLKQSPRTGERYLDREFVLEARPGYRLEKDDESYKQAIDRVFQWMHFHVSDEEAMSPTIVRYREDERKKFIDQLYVDFKQYSNGYLGSIRAFERAYASRGKYDLALEDLSRSLFVVKREAADIRIEVTPHRRISDDPAGQAKQSLYVALNSAITVVKTVADRIEDRGKRRWWSFLRSSRPENQTSRIGRQQGMLETYLAKLEEIARLGLQNPHVELANAALNGFRAEFVTREAGRIKNAYLRSLGRAALVGAAIFFVLYIVVLVFCDPDKFIYTHKAFLLAAGSSAIGTWLSFSIRRVTLGFDDLAVLEEDRLDPGLRVIFVITLTMVVLLLFWTGAMNIEIGNLKTGDLSNPRSELPIWAIALLVGSFCGISERALTTAISGRAVAFIRSLGT